MNKTNELWYIINIIIENTFRYANIIPELVGLWWSSFFTELFLSKIKEEYVFWENMDFYLFMWTHTDLNIWLKKLKDLNIISDSNFLHLKNNSSFNVKGTIYDFTINNWNDFFIWDIDKIEFLKKYINNKWDILNWKEFIDAEKIIDLINKIWFDKIYLWLEIPEYLKIKELNLYVYYILNSKTKYIKDLLAIIDTEIRLLWNEIDINIFQSTNFYNNITNKKDNITNKKDNIIETVIITDTLVKSKSGWLLLEFSDKEKKLIKILKSNNNSWWISRENLMKILKQNTKSAFNGILLNLRKKIKEKKLDKLIKITHSKATNTYTIFLG